MRSLIIVFIALFGFTSGADAGEKSGSRSSVLVPKTYRVLDINRIGLGVTDRGNLVETPFRLSAGYIWSLDDSSRWGIGFDHGPWIIGKTAEGLVMGNTYWGTSYMPGPVIDGRPALDVRPQDSLRYHPYKISRTSPADDPDLLAWPTDLGAPSSSPSSIFGDQMIWTVFNGADSTARPSDWQPHAKFIHMPVEIQQTVYAHQGSASDTSLLANSAFLEWTFINKGTALIESCYVGIWTDLDFTEARTPFGVDTATQTGYCWEYPSVFDTLYSPKAAGYTLLFGPRVPDLSSSAMFRGRRVQGYRNLPMSSFWGMRNDYGRPDMFPIGPNTVTEAWNVARGFDKLGQVIIDSVTRQPTKFPWSGDPVTGTGWVYTTWTEFEGGLMFFTGPFTFAPGDTQWTLIALHPAAAKASMEAVTTMRINASRLRMLSYDEIVAGKPLAVDEMALSLPSMPMLWQNYPNPFNPGSDIRYQIPAPRGAAGSEFRMVRLAVYDLLGREVAVLVNERKAPGSYTVRFDGSGLASGVYLCRMSAGPFVESRKMLLLR